MSKKNSLRNIGLLVMGVLISASCEKVIDVDLNSSSPKIVIEGSISDQPGPYTVSLSKSINFNGLNNFPPVSNAVIEISDNSGNSETLTEKSPGFYTTASIQGVPGKIYTLKVTVEGKTYSAMSTMPLPVNIKTLTVEEPTGGFADNEKYVEARYADPAGIDNYYRFVPIVNDVEQKEIIIDKDQLQDGNTLKTTVTTREKLKSGDEVTVFLQSIDKGVYEFYRTLIQSGGESSTSPSPTNPLSNFDGDVLGYFSAYSVTSKAIVVP